MTDLTSAHIPYQYNGNPSSDDRRQRRRRHRTPSPIDFWPSPSPPSEKVYDRMYRSSPPQIPLRFTPPPPLPPRAAWRGKEALEACLTGRWRGWRHEEEDDDEEEPKRNKQKRKRTSRKRAASNSSAADASAIEMSPVSTVSSENPVLTARPLKPPAKHAYGISTTWTRTTSCTSSKCGGGG